MFETSLFAVNVHYVIWPVLVLTLAVGVFAAAAPKVFSKFARKSSEWVDTSEWIKKFEQPINIDQLAYNNCRVFGVLVALTSVGLAGWFWQLS